jgi:hypothetical protein
MKDICMNQESQAQAQQVERRKGLAARPSPRDPVKPIFVHPEGKDVDGHYSLPQPSAPRDMPSSRRSGELPCRLRCYLQLIKYKRNTSVYAEAHPDLLDEKGALKSQEDWNLLRVSWCTKALLLDGMILVTSASDSAYVDTHDQACCVPT